MHPALHCWREEMPAALVRLLAYVGGAAVLSIAAAHFLQAQRALVPAEPAEPSPWIDIVRPFPAFALSIPEAAGAPASYTIRYNRFGGGRKDILSLGEIDSPAPYLHVEIYRAGSEIARFSPPSVAIVAAATALKPTGLHVEPPLDSKFGSLAIVTFAAAQGTPRRCLGFVRVYDEPVLQLAGWFCRGGEFIERSTLACALDRLTLLAAGSERKIGALFAKAELNRSFCGEHDPILAATPKFKLLWQALATRTQPRRSRR